MIRLVLVHEVRLVADLLLATLAAEADLTVGQCFTSPEQALSFLDTAPCDVLLVSATLPADGALALSGRVQKSQGAPKILVIGLPACEALILRYLEAGVAGYVTTQDSLTKLVQHIHAVGRAAFPLPPAIAGVLLTRLQALKQSVNEFYALQTMNPTTLYASLTAREGEVLALLEQGYKNEQISQQLFISLGTVKNHVHNLLDKLGVPTRSQAAILARQTLTAQPTQLSPSAPPLSLSYADGANPRA